MLHIRSSLKEIVAQVTGSAEEAEKHITSGNVRVDAAGACKNPDFYLDPTRTHVIFVGGLTIRIKPVWEINVGAA